MSRTQPNSALGECREHCPIASDTSSGGSIHLRRRLCEMAALGCVPGRPAPLPRVHEDSPVTFPET